LRVCSSDLFFFFFFLSLEKASVVLQVV